MKTIAHCPECGHHLNIPVDKVMGYCPLCDKDVFVFCPECRNQVQRECVIGADESATGLVERLYSCDECGSAWLTQEVDGKETDPQRYLFG